MAAKLPTALPIAQWCKLITFSKSKVVPGFVPNTFFLIVTGTKPCANMDVTLNPLIYIQKPQYWGIQVVGCLPGGICLPAVVPYSVHIPLQGIIGTKGIEVIGSNKKKKHKVP
jgi:hypothetical protein